MTLPAPAVFIVDDEDCVTDGVALLLRSAGLPSRAWNDPQRFLDEYRADLPGCLVLDVHMPRLSGLALQHELRKRRCTLPVIFMTGHGDVPMAVEAMRAGAFDFLQKPFKDEDLLRRVRSALVQDAHDRAQLRRGEEQRARWNELTPREREVADRLVDGQANKVIAAELQISERTVELHRSRVMQKMEARSLAQLVQFALRLRDSVVQT